MTVDLDTGEALEEDAAAPEDLRSLPDAALYALAEGAP